jgi:N-acetylglutamate synthase-like GNAT family acetyltransferase
MEPPLTITTDITRLDVDTALALLHRTPWARDMPRERLVTAMAHSLCFGVLQNEALVGFARVVTDRATFAYLTDVVIAERVRGRGIGRRLLEVIIAHPDLQGLRRFALLTEDGVSLYGRHGFQVGAGSLTYMERR